MILEKSRGSGGLILQKGGRSCRLISREAEGCGDLFLVEEECDGFIFTERETREKCGSKDRYFLKYLHSSEVQIS